ncbi:two-component system chemotaxis response regulator CheB [Methanofollis sp. W23]|uniref:chemotaxis protein CheB n=1 Tax=Methanofollis sp. W23 TaxID=2817849 RepID=UPI001AE5B8A0|nr:chemotaxis protein CheB [Methanofollis sp. W23]MBP2145187.1 two-component system chemotaxis response regulator CheB [Methanofollis sp. W23]
MIRILIVDDSVFIRTILRDIFSKSPEIEVVGVASDGAEALKQIDILKPDVMTLDIEMPKLNGLQVLEGMKRCRHRPKVMMLSSLTAKDAEHTKKALALGADDFMLKPTEIFKVRGIEEELVTRIKHLIEIKPAVKVAGRRDRVASTVVLFGSSAGGLQQLDLVLSRLSPDLGAAIVVTQHMPAGFTAALAERFNRICPLPVRESENGTVLMEGEVVISKAGYHSLISAVLTRNGTRGGKIIHSSAPPVHAVRPAIDKTFSSGAKIFKNRTLAVVMSGMGNDCGAGAADVRAAGGTVYVCKEHDCLVYGMARSALKTNCVNQVVSLRHIPEEVMKTVKKMEAVHG